MKFWLFVWYFPQFCTSDMSKYGYLECFSGSLQLRDNESRLYVALILSNIELTSINLQFIIKTGTRKCLNIHSIKCDSELQLNLSYWDTSVKKCAKRPTFLVKNGCFQYKLTWYEQAPALSSFRPSPVLA